MPEIEFTKIDPAINRQWKEIVNILGKLNDGCFAAKMLYDIYQTEASFAAQNQIPIPYIDPNELKNHVLKVDKLKRVARAVQDNKLGVRASNGDIDVVAPPYYTNDMIQGILGGFFIPILIGIGIVVVTGLSMAVKSLFSENKEIRGKYNAIVRATDKTFCADPKSQKCQKWLEMKAKENLEERLSITEKISRFLGGMGGALKTGGSIGLAIALPLIGFMLFRKK